MNENGDRDFGNISPRTPHIHALSQRQAQRKVLSHSDVLEISLICTSCMLPAHQTCRPGTERLHVQSSAPIVSMSSLERCTIVTFNKKDVPRVEQATFRRSMQGFSYMHSTYLKIHTCPFILVLCVAGGRVLVSHIELFNAGHAIEIKLHRSPTLSYRGYHQCATEIRSVNSCYLDDL